MPMGYGDAFAQARPRVCVCGVHVFAFPFFLFFYVFLYNGHAWSVEYHVMGTARSFGSRHTYNDDACTQTHRQNPHGCLLLIFNKLDETVFGFCRSAAQFRWVLENSASFIMSAYTNSHLTIQPKHMNERTVVVWAGVDKLTVNGTNY